MATNIKALEAALTSVLEDGQPRTIDEIELTRHKEGRKNVLSAAVGSETLQDTDPAALARAIVAAEKSAGTNEEKSEEDELADHKPPILTRAMVKAQREAALADMTPAGPPGRRVRITALEQELFARLEAISTDIGHEFAAVRSDTTRYMRALYDLSMDGEIIYEGLTLNEVLMVTGGIGRAREIVSDILQEPEKKAAA